MIIKKLKAFLKFFLSLIRVKHWVKNAFVFLPAFFASKAELLFAPQTILVFLSFSLAASSIYILNDWVDKEKDRLHPEKKKRPLASGFFNDKQAFIILAFILLLLCTSLFFIKHAHLYVIGYFIMNIAYSFKLKQISILDVSIISTGFVLRVLAGGAETGVTVSHWMIIMVFLLTVSIAFAKRRDDLVLALDQNKVRKSLEGYNLQFLDMAKVMGFSITLISYVMYSISDEIIARMESKKVYLTSIFVFIGIMRYLQLSIVFKQSGSPVDILWKDKFMQLIIFFWILSFGIIIYGNNI